MAIAEVRKTAEQKMQRSVETLKADYQKVRTGRAHTGLLDHIQVDYYGSMLPISQCANVTLADARTITVQPWEKKMVPVIEKAILESDLGLNPVTAGEVIRVPLPPLTEERRREMTRLVRHEGENGKVAIRNVRRDAIHRLRELLKEKEIPQDDEKHAEEELQKLTDRYTKIVDEIVAAKEEEIMEV